MKRLLALPALAALALPAFAQDPAPVAEAPKLDPLIAQIAENLPKLKDAKWESAHTIQASMHGGSLNGSFTSAWQDLKHFKVNVSMKATPPAPEEGSTEPAQEPQDIQLDAFADGTHLWIISPLVGKAMGGMEGVKVELAVVEQMLPMMMSQMGQGGGMAPDAAGLQGMIAGLTAGFTVKEEGSTDLLRRLVFEGQGWKGDAQFDSKTWFPMSVQMGSEAQKSTVQFRTGSFSLKESFPEGTFSAKGIDAAKVMDLTGLLQAQLGQAGGGADEDLEF